jgi:DNA-binding NarL/FixJ family response regulator
MNPAPTKIRPRLILADDHQILVDGLRAMLSTRFDVVGVAYDGEQLLTLLRATSADCLLLDLAFPGRSGLELLPDVRALRPEMKVLIVTMHLDRVLADAVMHAGASGFIPKDSGVEELGEAIEQVLAGNSYLSPRVPPNPRSSGATHASLAALTPRQHEIVRLMGDGLSSAEIGAQLGLSPNTITFHRTRIRKILGLDSEWALNRLAILVQVGDQTANSLTAATNRATSSSVL